MITAKIGTTVIGSMSKPAYLEIPCWVKDGKQVLNVEEVDPTGASAADSEEIKAQLKRATQEIIDLQNNAGIETVTDGELKRDMYINGFCQNLNGFDFVNKKRSWHRNGSREELLPMIVSKISLKNHGLLAEEWQFSQAMSKASVKITIPGPITIMDTFYNDFYEDEETLLQDLANCINLELKNLALAGCKQVQVSS